MSYETMIERFKGMTKEEMIEKYNSPNCAPMWDRMQKLEAQQAMKDLLSGKVPNIKIVAEVEKVEFKSDAPIIEKREETADEAFLRELSEGEEKKDDGKLTAEDLKPAPPPPMKRVARPGRPMKKK